MPAKPVNLKDLRDFVVSRKWTCYFESEIVAWVFVWYQEGNNAGHVSILIGDLGIHSTYVSWWPQKKVDGFRSFLGKGPSGRIIKFNENSHCLEYETSSYVDDCLSEGNCPHVIYGLRSVNVREMKSAWHGIVSKEKSSFSTLNKNCASIASRVLKAGLKDSPLQHRVFGVFGGGQYVWTPKRIAVICNQLRDNNVAWKIKMPGRENKKTILASLIRLR